MRGTKNANREAFRASFPRFPGEITMRRILIVGPGGGGKSTLARRIASRLDLPLIHLDARYWRPGWVAPPKDAWRQTVERLTQGERWVMDGNYGGTLALRLDACDTAILMDMPPHVCLWRILRRRWTHRGVSRPDMAPGCPETIDPRFLGWIALYRWRHRPAVLARFAEAAAMGKRTVVLDSDAAVEAFLAALPATGG